MHSLELRDGRLIEAPRLNESDFFRLDIAEGCVMYQLIQPGPLNSTAAVRPEFKTACCLLKEENPAAERRFRLREVSCRGADHPAPENHCASP